MSGVTLRLDGERWREHLRTVAGATPGIVPVIKGNGYGFGLRRLAEESVTLGADTVGVGIPSEVGIVREAFPGDVVILNPWDPASELATELTKDSSVITTVSRLQDLELLAARGDRPRVLVEVLTSMQRHGIRPDDLGQVAACSLASGSRVGRSTCRCTPTVATPRPSGWVTLPLLRRPEGCGFPTSPLRRRSRWRANWVAQTLTPSQFGSGSARGSG